MKFEWTNSSSKVLDIIKYRITKNYEDKNIEKINIKITKKKHFLAIPIPSTSPAFTLYINDKFYKSYFYKDNSWMEIGD